MNRKSTILIADDHALLRMGLSALLGYQDDMSVVGEARDGREAVRLAKKLRPDLVLMDLAMPVMNGSEATRQILEALPETRIFILTSYPESIELAKALSGGASGAACKDTPNEELLALLRKTLSGERVIPPGVDAHLKTLRLFESLTGRQLEFLKLAARGFNNEDIGRQLGVTLDAVKKQFSTIFQKLVVSNRTEAVALVQSVHLLDNP